MVTCELCEENEAVEGWHYGVSDKPRDPCVAAPPRTARIVTDPSTLRRFELDALLRIGEVFGPVKLDIAGAVASGDYL